MSTDLKRLTISPDVQENGNAIVFVHGLSGSPESTWRKMSACFDSDLAFKGVVLDYYRYPTRLIRLPFTPPLPGLRGLSEGLRTFLEERHGGREAIYIVAHSLGGVIVRHMIASAIRMGRALPIKKVALLAVPSTGATLANVGSLVSLKHRQLKTLCKDDEALTELNIEWEHLNVEGLLQVRYLMGGCDRTVPPDSAAPYIGRDNRSLLIEATHRSIVSPDGHDDIRYKTVKRFLLDPSQINEKIANTPAEAVFRRAADPLFDVYSPDNEVYYLNRSFDRILTEVLARGHVWLTGESGIGKSASARRAVYSGGWRLYHISLSGHSIGNADDLFGALCSELSSLTDEPINRAAGSTFLDDASIAKKALLALRTDKIVANLIEEMPVRSEDLAGSAAVIARFLDLIDADERLYGQVRFAFSSRMPIPAGSPVASKVREKIQFLPVDAWSSEDIARLVLLLTSAVKPDLSAAEQAHIAGASGGSPRFVKMVFRHWRNRTSNDASVDKLCAQVAGELVS